MRDVSSRLAVLALLVAFAVPVHAADETTPATEAPEAKPGQLSGRQTALSSRYQRFEKMLIQMAEYLHRVDPEQADLLMRAIGQSKNDAITPQMEQIIEYLKGDDIGEAIDRQDQLIASLRELLNLLQSEDRRNELKDEMARIEGLIKDVNKVIGEQKVARAATQRNASEKRAMNTQEKAADDTEDLVDKINKQDGDEKSKDGEPKDGEPKDGEPKDGERKDGEPKDGEPKDGEPKDGEPKDGEPKDGEPKDGQPKDGQPKDGQPKSGNPKQSKQKQTPGREQLEKAKKEMEQAIKELQKKQKENATDHQDEALAELIKAKEKLEEILRQLREEERELMLAALEARFQKMLAMQMIVNTGTQVLVETPKDKWIDRYFSRSRELSQTENEIALEAAKALDILKEEGTSISFPLAVENIREDMLTVADRLERSEADALTAAIEESIVEALEEMLLALQKEMDKSDKDGEGKPCDCNGDPVLVDVIAELKMLRTLQKRVNRRTRQLGELIEDDSQAEDPDVVDQLRKLSRRQERIQESAEEIIKQRDQK